MTGTGEKKTAPRVSDHYDAFKNFDTVCERENAMTAPSELKVSLERSRAMIDALPQRKAITSETVDRWLEQTYRMAKRRMEIEHGQGGATVANIHEHVRWHIRRLSGFGGSEVGTIVNHYRGKRGTFGDAAKIVKEKLMLLSPLAGNETMNRGVRMEKWIQRMLREDENIVSDEDSLAKLRGFRWPKRPASIGTPDDIVLGALEDGQRQVIDYKAPSADVIVTYDDKGVSFDYVCQLHHYGIIARAADITFSPIMAIRALDPASYTVRSYEVPFEDGLAKEIVLSTERLWLENVMAGFVPEVPKPAELTIADGEFRGEFMEKIRATALLKSIADQAKSRVEKDMNKLKDALALSHGIDAGKLDLGFGSFSRDRKWDEEKLLQLADQAGVDASLHYKPGKKLNQDKALTVFKDLIALLKKDGMDTDDGALSMDTTVYLIQLMQEGIPMEQSLDADSLAKAIEAEGHDANFAAKVQESLKFSAKKSGEEAERVECLKAGMSTILDYLEETLGADNGKYFLTAVEQEAADAQAQAQAEEDYAPADM